jgi:single-strand DNA-binding protein
MNDLTMTVSGWVATKPKLHVGPSGVRMTTFRLASTSRYFDRDKGEWVDSRTEWFSVRTFRAAAVTVSESVEKGQPVTVHGRFRTNEWESEGGTRTDLIIDATSVGHDLTRGIATFHRATADGNEPKPDDAAESVPDESDGGAAEEAPTGTAEEAAVSSDELVEEPELVDQSA